MNCLLKQRISWALCESCSKSKKDNNVKFLEKLNQEQLVGLDKLIELGGSVHCNIRFAIVLFDDSFEIDNSLIPFGWKKGINWGIENCLKLMINLSEFELRNLKKKG